MRGNVAVCCCWAAQGKGSPSYLCSNPNPWQDPVPKGTITLSVKVVFETRVILSLFLRKEISCQNANKINFHNPQLKLPSWQNFIYSKMLIYPQTSCWAKCIALLLQQGCVFWWWVLPSPLSVAGCVLFSLLWTLHIMGGECELSLSLSPSTGISQHDSCSRQTLVWQVSKKQRPCHEEGDSWEIWCSLPNTACFLSLFSLFIGWDGLGGHSRYSNTARFLRQQEGFGGDSVQGKVLALHFMASRSQGPRPLASVGLSLCVRRCLGGSWYHQWGETQGQAENKAGSEEKMGRWEVTGLFSLLTKKVGTGEKFWRHKFPGPLVGLGSPQLNSRNLEGKWCFLCIVFVYVCVCFGSGKGINN